MSTSPEEPEDLKFKRYLAQYNCRETQDGNLEQDLENGTIMQIRLKEDRVNVEWRTGPPEQLTSWGSAYGLPLNTWKTANSPVWQWLLRKGLDEAACLKKLLR